MRRAANDADVSAMGRLTGMRPLNLYKGDHTDPTYVLPGLSFDNDELLPSSSRMRAPSTSVEEVGLHLARSQ